MAPDRGDDSDGMAGPSDPQVQALLAGSEVASSPDDDQASGKASSAHSHNDMGKYLAEDCPDGCSFTMRGLAVGLAVGILICFSNTFFGLQTGWISGMTMPASLIGFAFFKAISKHLSFPFSPVENVLVQTVASAAGTMPLGSGFVGVIPALEFLLTPAEGGPVRLGLGKLVVWSLGLSFFGVVFGVPLRKQVILKEKLKFPSGTATALMIGVLHGGGGNSETQSQAGGGGAAGDSSVQRLAERRSALTSTSQHDLRYPAPMESFSEDIQDSKAQRATTWKYQIQLLTIAFAASGTYTLVAYFVPQLRHIPFLGLTLARDWLWTFNLSPAYAAQGIIMGPATTSHMLLGAIIAWAILSPLAKTKGWAPGPVGEWESGSKGWIVWVSLAIMLVDAVMSLGWLVGRPLLIAIRSRFKSHAGRSSDQAGWKGWLPSVGLERGHTALVRRSEESTSLILGRSHSQESSNPGYRRSTETPARKDKEDSALMDAAPDQLISNRTVTVGLILSMLFCIVAIRISFGELVPIYATITAVFMALLLSVMGVRAMGETDLNPVSGISKLTQLVFALIIPRSNRYSVLINLIVGAVSEAGALQAGDMLQDLKTGHLLAASPKAQFQGQMVGSFIGAIASAVIYRLYTSVYTIPGDLFQVPTAYVWMFTARLVTGKGLPPMAQEFAIGAALMFATTSALRIVGTDKSWQSYVPGGIAVAVGMYNIPSFTLARAIGGFLNWYWLSYRKKNKINKQNNNEDESTLIVLASGLILGEGVLSIVNLILASLGVPHL